VILWRTILSQKKGAFYNTETKGGQANGPWLWEPKELVDKIEKGGLWVDPASVVKNLFEVGTNFGTNYHKEMKKENW